MNNNERGFSANRLRRIKRSMLVLALCMPLSLCGCVSANTQKSNSTFSGDVQQSENASSKPMTSKELSSEEEKSEVVSAQDQIIIDYGDAQSFESDLNEGKNLEGKIVRFTAKELHPDSAFGYNVCSGEHLNFVSEENPDIKENDVVTVRATKIKSFLGSWIIKYEKVDNAVIGEETIISSGSSDTSEEGTSSESSSEETEGTYEENEYYDIIETASYTDSIGYTHLIHKVKAKKDASIDATMLAYDEDGNVIGKSTSDIVLTKGENNFFSYSFESDISKAKLQATAKATKDSFTTGERSAVEMVKYNKSGNDLYITVKQVKDNIAGFAKFKLLYYKDGTIIGTEEGYISTRAENLNGKDTTDVMSVWVYGEDFDEIEFIYEP